MSIDAIDLLRKKVVPFFKNDLANVEKGTGPCEIFKTETDGYKVKDSYDVETIQSDVVRIFTIGSYETIGLNMGTWENPRIPMRFMDYKGATMVIPTNNDQPEFWCGGNYVAKLSPTIPFLAKDLTGARAMLSLLEDHREMLVISITPRKELWLKNLIVGSENHLVYCHETGAITIPRQGWKEFKEAYLALDKKKRSEALVVLRGTTKGMINNKSDRVQKFFNENTEFAQVCMNTLPASPLARTYWFFAIGAAA